MSGKSGGVKGQPKTSVGERDTGQDAKEISVGSEASPGVAIRNEETGEKKKHKVAGKEQ